MTTSLELYRPDSLRKENMNRKQATPKQQSKTSIFPSCMPRIVAHLPAHTTDAARADSELQQSPPISLDDWVYVNDEDRKMSDKYIEEQTWFDDIPVDVDSSGVGFATNQLYKKDGYRHEDHVFEDTCFRFRLSQENCLYGIFDGHCGIEAANFVSQRLAAEIVLDKKLEHARSDTEICRLLQEAYISVEAAYFASMDSLIAERTLLQQQINHNMDANKVSRLRQVDRRLSSGSSALIVLVRNNKIYVSNVGNSRAVLCKTHPEQGIVVEQLNTDHTLENENEVLRLSKLGVPDELLRGHTMLGQQIYTRCLGDYSVKGGYKDNDQLSMATSEPVIATPELCPAIPVDSSCLYLMLMSDGVYRSLADARDTNDVNLDVAHMVLTEFQYQTNLNGVAQSVIDMIQRIHRDAFQHLPAKDTTGKRFTRDDMTLMIRNFRQVLGGASRAPGTPERALIASQLSTHHISSHTPSPSYTQWMYTLSNPTPMTLIDGTAPYVDHPTVNSDFHGTALPTFFSQLPDTGGSLLETLDEESLVDTLNSVTSSVTRTLDRDSDGRIEPYVDFSHFNNVLANMTPAERNALFEQLKPKLDCETIEEQPDLEAVA